MDSKALLVAATTALLVFLGAWRIDYGLRVEQQDAARQQFETNAARATAIVNNRVGLVIDLLNDTGNLVAQTMASGGSATAVFDRFAIGGDILGRYPEMDALAFMRFARAGEVERIAAEINADPDRTAGGHGAFDPKPPSELEQHVLVELIHPLSFSQRMSGFDLMTTPRRGTLERAIALRESAASSKITLFGDRPGLVIYHPVYKAAEDETPLGFTATGFVTDVFIRNLRSLLAPLDVDVTIYDRGLAEEAPLPFGEPSRLGTFISDLAAAQAGLVSSDPRTVFNDIRVADRLWTVAARPAAPPPVAPWMPNLNTVLGGFVALLVGALTYVTRRDTRKLSSLVGERTQELEAALKELEERRAVAQHQAVHDDLTALFNRRGLRGALNTLLKDDDATVFSIDLDGFKAINDSRGHSVGDAVLQAVGHKLQSLAPTDALVARMAGDEFIVAVPMSRPHSDIDLIAGLLGWTASPVRIAEQEIRIGVSIGVSQSTVSGRDASALIADADIALYRAKNAGKNQYAVCSPGLRKEHDARQLLGEELRNALDRDEIEPFFQTQHASDDHRIIGAEALARWAHPEKGLVPPAKFLSLAEDLGLISEIDSRILTKSVGYMRELEDQGLVLPKLSVNVSYARLTDPNLRRLIDHLPGTATKLVFEIVEAVLLDDRNDLTSWELDAIRERGIGIELDDFGTGHASVVALTELRPDRMKVDKKFVIPLPDPSYEDLLRAIVGIGRAMKIPLTAEGVETEAQAQILQAMGVDALQGYLFGKPCSFPELRMALQKNAA